MIFISFLSIVHKKIYYSFCSPHFYCNTIFFKLCFYVLWISYVLERNFFSLFYVCKKNNKSNIKKILFFDDFEEKREIKNHLCVTNVWGLHIYYFTKGIFSCLLEECPLRYCRNIKKYLFNYWNLRFYLAVVFS